MAKSRRSSKKATPATTPSRASKRTLKDVSYKEEHDEVKEEVDEDEVVASTPKKGRTPSRASKQPPAPVDSDSEFENGNGVAEEEEEEKPAPSPKKGGRGRPKSVGTPKPKSKKAPPKRAASSGASTSTKKTRAADASEDSDEEDEEEYEVERILDVKYMRNGKREFHIKWKGWSINDSTWEPEEHLQCKELLDAFIAKVDDLRDVSQHELRVARQQTQRYTDANRNPGVRTSRRFTSKPRQMYHGLDD